MLSKARWCSYNNNQQGLNGPKTFHIWTTTTASSSAALCWQIGEVYIDKLIIVKYIHVLSLRCLAGAVFSSLSFVVATFRYFWHKDYSMMMCFSPHLHQVFITELVIKLHGLQKQEDLHNNGIEHPQLHIFPDCQGSPERHWETLSICSNIYSSSVSSIKTTSYQGISCLHTENPYTNIYVKILPKVTDQCMDLWKVSFSFWNV